MDFKTLEWRAHHEGVNPTSLLCVAILNIALFIRWQPADTSRCTHKASHL